MKYCKYILFFLPLLSRAQSKVTLVSELRQLSDLSLLPAYRTNTLAGQQSTYDLKGGNDDGFAGTYSFIRKNADGSLVMLDIDGPGVLDRIATPTPTQDTLDFYLDHEQKPRLSVGYQDLFTDNAYPFVRPLCDSAVGGYFAYFPILFQKHLKIVCRGRKLQFHQLQYRLFPRGTQVESFHLPLNDEEKTALEKVAVAWSATGLKEQPERVRATINPGETQLVFEAKKGGRFTGLEFDTAGTAHLRLRLTWDGARSPAVDCPLREFFGYAFGQPAMQGLLCGTKAIHYAYFPMPFDQGAKVELINEGMETVAISARASFEATKRDRHTEGKFYANFVQYHLGEKDPFHVFLSIKGKGHYVGTILKGMGNYKGMTGFFEGDDSTATDGKFRIHGTGSEDYFNGGWYDMKGRWDHAESRPLSGCLGYGREPAHTGGFRFLIGDKISFEQSFYQNIEHGGSPSEGIPADYTSVSYYYCDRGKEQQIN